MKEKFVQNFFFVTSSKLIFDFFEILIQIKSSELHEVFIYTSTYYKRKFPNLYVIEFLKKYWTDFYMVFTKTFLGKV